MSFRINQLYFGLSVVVVSLFCLVQPVSAISAQQVPELPQVTQDVEWHPHGEGLLVTGRAGQGVWGLWLYDTNLQLKRFFQFENPVSADWSPDGTRFSMGRNIVNAQTLDILVTLNANSGIGGWSPDGSQVLAWADETHLGLFNAVTGVLERRIAVGEMIPDAISWSPDGQYFAFLQPTGETNIIRVADGSLVSTMTMQYPLGLRWSPDSRLLAAGFLERVEPGTPGTLPDAPSPTLAIVRVWDALTGDLSKEYSGMLSVPQVLRWGMNQHELFGATSLGLLYVWNLETDTSTALGTLGNLGPMDFSPYGGRLIIGANILLQNVANAERQALIPDRPYWSQVLVPNVLEVIVPAPSLDRLNAIAALCVRDGNAGLSSVQGLAQPAASTADLPAYIARVEALPADAIPPACRADLLAVAGALLAGE